ncbi:MAG: carboxypeptidase regulatory-like domain-containing protein [Melioribacteraceae bacterium]|nr:carboxypeptidase regulatory-like domain-containing protein [Melioribacteraceae bacterium]
MKRYIKSAFVITLLVLAAYSCKLGIDPSEDAQNKEGTVIITGVVVDSTSGNPVAGATVRFTFGSEELATTTNEDGKFNTDIFITGNADVRIEITKSNYKRLLIDDYLTAGQSIDLGVINLERSENAIDASGDAAVIVLSAISNGSIGILESGSPVTSVLTFLVQDSVGTAIDLQHKATVNFSIVGGPGGGEYISPVSGVTNAFGIVSTTLTSGLSAGAVQVSAMIESETGNIYSNPVSVVIHGGFPDDAHFSIAAEQLNIPGGIENWVVEDNITAYVGDKYSNPVKPQTAVYFESTGGIMEAEVFTNALGRGTNILTTSAPFPNHPTYGLGFATITASTRDENSEFITTDMLILFSGKPQTINLTPSSFIIPNAGSETFHLLILDPNGNPIAGGSSISIRVEGEGVSGGETFEVYDGYFPGDGTSDFYFVVSDTDPDENKQQPVSIVIQITISYGGNSFTVETAYSGISY